MSDYRREWDRFADWCESVGKVPLPATDETVLAYLAEETPSAGAMRRWVAAISARHRAAGVTDPCLGMVRALARSARRGDGTDGSALVAEAGKPAVKLSLVGWPNGLFGRRDRLAFILHRLGAISVPALLAMRTDDLVVPDPHRVEITTRSGVVMLQSPKGAPTLCPACAAFRWGWALSHADQYATRDLAAKLSDPETLLKQHMCEQERLFGRQWAPSDWPVFPAVDRWGSFPPKPAPAMSVRSMEGVLRAVRAALAVRTPVRVPGVRAGEADLQPVPVCEAPASTREELQRSHAQGVASRTRAKASLAEIDDRYDELDEEMDEIAARIQRLLDEISEG